MMFRATDTGGTDELRRLTTRMLAGARDKCGRTILHKAILNKKKEVIKLIVQTYKHILDLQDNVSNGFKCSHMQAVIWWLNLYPTWW